MGTTEIIAKVRSKWGVTSAQADDAFLTEWIGDLRELVDPDIFEGAEEDALAALAAHHARMVDPTGAFGSIGGAAGPLTSIKTSSLSATFGAPSGGAGSDSEYQTTAAGRYFLQLRESRPLTILPTWVGV